MRVRQREILPGAFYHLGQRTTAKVMEAVSEGDALYVSGQDGGHLELSKADAAAAATCAGRLYVARKAMLAAVAGRAVDLPLDRMVLESQDTSAGAIGQPVYLKDGGGWSFTAGTVKRIIGFVIAADASAGTIFLCPNEAVAADLQKSGSGSITEAATTLVVALGAGFSNAPVVATMASTDGVTLYVESAIVNGAGSLTITLDQAPGAGKTTVVNYMVDAR
jgi:hypothetical protein